MKLSGAVGIMCKLKAMRVVNNMQRSTNAHNFLSKKKIFKLEDLVKLETSKYSNSFPRNPFIRQ